MKKIMITVGVGYEELKNGSFPANYKFFAGVNNCISGRHGIPIDGGCKSKDVEIEVPDFVVASEKRNGVLSRNGHTAPKSGEENLCFIETNTEPEMAAEFYGSCDQNALIDKAIKSGFKLIYPENGEQKEIPVKMIRIVK